MLILSEIETLLADWPIKALKTISSVILIFLILDGIIRFSPRLLDTFRKTDWCTKTFFAFMEVAIYSLTFFETRVIFNFIGLVNLRAIYQLICYFSFYKNFCYQSFLSFLTIWCYEFWACFSFSLKFLLPFYFFLVLT